MAFTPSTLSVILQTIGGVGMRFVSYRSDDAIGTVSGSGYFAGGESYGLRLHDLVFVSPVSGSVEPYILVVTAVDSDGSVTATQTIFDEDLTALVGLDTADGNFIVGNGTTWVAESGATARDSLGLGTADSPQYTAIELGHATDTTIARASAGRIAVEGVGVLLETDVRVRLTSNRTYYVRTDGSDSNTGLTNDSGGAFLTVQKAIDVALSIDMSIYAVTVSVGAGTFAQNIAIQCQGNTRLTISGAGSGSTTIGSGSGTQFLVNYGGSVVLQNLAIASGGSVGIWARFGAVVFLSGTIRLGSATARQIGVDIGAYVESTSGTIELNGDSTALLYCEAFGSIVLTNGVTITTLAARSYSSNVVYCSQGRVSLGASITWNESAGAISGKRYLADQCGVIYTSGSVIPGTVAGTTATGGQYV